MTTAEDAEYAEEIQKISHKRTKFHEGKPFTTEDTGHTEETHPQWRHLPST